MESSARPESFVRLVKMIEIRPVKSRLIKILMDAILAFLVNPQVR